MSKRPGQPRKPPGPRRVSPGQWFAALDRAGPNPSNAQLAALVPCSPDSVRRFGRRFGWERPADPPAPLPTPAPAPAVRALPAARPVGSPGTLLYGWTSDGSTVEAAACSAWVFGRPGSGKSSALAALGQQLAAAGGTVLVADPHAGLSGSLTGRLGLDPADVATDPDSAAGLVAVAHAELERRTAARELDPPPFALVIDEWGLVAGGRPMTGMVAQLRAIVTAGRKVRVLALIGAQVVAGAGSAVPPELRDAAPGRIVLQVHGADLYRALGIRKGELPDEPALLAAGRAFVQVPGVAGVQLVTLPEPTRDGAPIRRPELPAIDARRRQREARRELAHARGVALDRIAEAGELVRDEAGDEAAAIRGALAEAVRIARQAGSLRELRDELEPYAADVEAAQEIGASARARIVRAEQAEQARGWNPRAVEELYDDEPAAEYDEPEPLADWTPRSAVRYSRPIGLGALGAVLLNAALGNRAGVRALTAGMRTPAPPAPAPPPRRRWDAVTGRWTFD